jgi:hypothetical protein
MGLICRYIYRCKADNNPFWSTTDTSVTELAYQDEI